LKRLRNQSLLPAQERRYKKLKAELITAVKSLRRIDALVEQLYDINKSLVAARNTSYPWPKAIT
jgi:RNA polymerase primary sigma factor